MIPSNRWFPSGLPQRAAWYVNFTKQFGEVAAGLGFTAGEVTSVENDNSIIQFLAGLTVEMKAFAAAARQYRIIITENNAGSPTPTLPAAPTMTLPVVVPTGIFERLDNLANRIRLASGYTNEIGAALGIIPAVTNAPEPENLQPTAQAKAMFSGYKFTVNTTRMGMDGFKVQIRRMSSETWTDAAFGTSSPLEVTVAPTAPGQLERIEGRVVLLKKNEPVGQPSDPFYVTVNP